MGILEFLGLVTEGGSKVIQKSKEELEDDSLKWLRDLEYEMQQTDQSAAFTRVREAIRELELAQGNRNPFM